MAASAPDDAPQRPSTALLLAEAGWSHLLDRFLARFSHDLNGRAMALDAVVHFTDAGKPLTPVFREEVDRVRELARTLSLIPTELDAPPIPVVLGEALRPALRLYKSLGGPDALSIEVDVAAATPPVLVGEGRFLRALVVYLSFLTQPAEGEASLRVTGNEERAEIRGLVAGSAVRDRAFTSLAEVFALDAGHLSLEGEQCVLCIPSLATARMAARA